MTAAMPHPWPQTDEQPDHSRDGVELALVSSYSQSPMPGWSLLLVFPLALVLTLFAIGLPGRPISGVARGARVELRDASGTMGSGAGVADQLAAAGMTVVAIEPAGSIVRSTEIRYRGERGLARAKAVRRVLGKGSIVRSPGAPGLADVTVFIGKDVQHE